MGSLALAEDFASFRYIDPSSDGFRCIYPLIKYGRCCKNRVDKGLRNATLSIKRRILSEASSEDRSALLQNFVENCCCEGVHRKLLTGTPLARELRQKWEKELGYPFSTPVRASEDTQHAAPTITPASTRQCHVGSPVILAVPSRANTRYSLRTNVSVPEPTGSSLGSDEGASTGEFEPIKKTTQTLVSVLFKPLSEVRDREIGDIYAFSRESSPGMVKIGYSKSTESRLKRWGNACGYKPVLEHCVRNVPNVPRVETLVHYELLSYWRRELKCKHNSLCHKRHKEWFECSVETAARSMNNFSKWMIVADPYDAGGILKPQWKDIIRKMVRYGQEVTSQSLLDNLERPRHQIEAPLSAQIDEPISPPTPTATPWAPRESMTTVAPRPVALTPRGLDKAVLKIGRDLVYLQAHRIAALQKGLASLYQTLLVDNSRTWTPPNTQLLLAS
ncbi:uncharacterized protein A1O5_06658 [Cladophialophora psammophila CBS 110553]|uniref:Bacteriophage T5 Orf172 DNA-binding domain-containing protein n=1 Tax=Cladophialophora psammophila CBS 110553 TaxID=1182543 RepID=W9WRN1_9EURO|nr:uncharacterized protein A1O5_06658 [Cladophialophora psammophila CBS 110553]EXJ70588.1 hypothetical protein A1O5_06658 [Cladophialophora psammophila CBS 110553]